MTPKRPSSRGLKDFTDDGVVDFDDYHDNYREKLQESINFAGADHDFFVRVKADHLLHLIGRHVGDPTSQRVLDIGCGVGSTDQHLVGKVGELHGADISSRSIEQATANNPGVEYRDYSPNRLPYDDAQFDVAFAICVMHHVPPSDWGAFTAEARRVLKPGGLFAIYEHNPWNPATQYAVSRCEFDRDATLLSMSTADRLTRQAEMERVSREYILFIPRPGDAYRRVEASLRWLPLGAQYCLSARKAV